MKTESMPTFLVLMVSLILVVAAYAQSESSTVLESGRDPLTGFVIRD